jgi:hypothetical protein
MAEGVVLHPGIPPALEKLAGHFGLAMPTNW